MTSSKSQGIIRKGGDEKEKKQARGIPRQTTSNYQSQLKSVSLKSQDNSF